MTTKKFKAGPDKDLNGNEALIRSSELVTLGLSTNAKGTAVKLHHDKLTVLVVVKPADIFEDVVSVSESTWAKLREAKVDTEKDVYMTVVLLTWWQRLHRMASAARVAPLLAILAAVLTVVAGLTGQASAAGFPPLKVITAVAVGLSAVCAGWLGWQAAGR